MTLRKRTLALLIAAALTPQFAATAYAQAPGYAPPPGYAPAQAPTRAYTQAELDQMLAPIALYPDALLSQVLMAATYPIEVVEAARWTRANPGLRGDAAVRAVQYQDWDPSVKSLCAFPQILQRMDEHLQWTENLGDAFLAQEAAVMDSVQELRQRAYASGHLRSTDQIRVVHEGPYYYVRPVRPEIVYVPYYDPLVVYGDWRWPAYRPFAWAPWPGYVRPAPGISVGFWFGAPISLSANFFYGDFDWGRRSVRVVRPTAYYYRPPRVVVNNVTIVNRDRSTWQHDPHHRRGADYRQAEVRQRFAGAQTERRTEQRATLREERPAGRRDERGMERRAEQREAQRPEQRQAQSPRPQQEAQPQARPEQTRPERREAREEQRKGQREERKDERSQLQQREQAQAAERAQRQQREQAQSAERAQRDQQRQQAEAARAQNQQREQAQAAERAQRQQRDQAQAAERGQRDQQRQQAEAARAQQQQAQQQQRQQAEAARAQQQQAQQQQRQQAEAARAQQQQAQQQQRQQAEAARSQQRQQAREERKGQREDRREHHAGNKGD